MVRLIRSSVCLLVVVFASAVAHAQTAEEIVAKNLKAKGGVEKLKAMNTVKITGTISAQGMEFPMTTWARRPNLIRREMQIQDKRIVNAFDGETVWAINPMMTGSDEPQELTGPMATMTKDDADFDGVLVDYKEKGHTVELVGAETLEGKKVYHVTPDPALLRRCRQQRRGADGVVRSNGSDDGGGHDGPLELSGGGRAVGAVLDETVDERVGRRGSEDREGRIQPADRRHDVQDARKEVTAALMRVRRSSPVNGRTSTLPAS